MCNTKNIIMCDKNHNYIENSPRIENAMSITGTDIMITVLIVMVIVIRGFYYNLLPIRCYIGTITKHYNELKWVF
jgi:hypothetical protein